ncbi:(2Fe-2S)-binding protein [Actinacidiphila oryziradicis]|uniref:(2Fe-2S)-binding protein n=1 Tax=Actinacidiphila oryziradicis TaxID=2571141 RepID=UPI001FE791F7
MTDDVTGGGMTDQPQSGYEPWSPAEYDGDQTMHVSFAAQLPLPEPGTDPLAVQGNGQTPPWAHAPAPPDDPPTWAIPTVREDTADESGEYSLSAYSASWGSAPTAPEQQWSPPDPGPHTPPTGTYLPGGPALADPSPADGAAGSGDTTGQWRLPPGEPARDAAGDAAGQWGEPPAGPAEAGNGAGEISGDPSGEWAVPFAGGEVPEDSGDFLVRSEEAGPPADDPAEAPSEHPLASYVLRVNGTDRPVTGAWLGESLLYVLRERLGLAGAKDGCEEGECGACSVQVDGRLVASCLVPAATAAGCEVRTVEGLAAPDGRPSDVQQALADCGAVQCGFCIPGMAMTVHDLLEGNHSPTELETRQALCGNLCRCSGYRGVLDAVREVVASREAAAETATDAETPRIPHQSGGPA